MSIVTEPTPPPGAAPPELSPSATMAETPALARAVGFAGLFLLVVGLVAVITNRVLTPRWIGTTTGYFLCATGLALMLYHAVRDGEREVRRMYGALAALCVLLGLAAALIPGPVFGEAAKVAADAKSQAVGYNLLPWGVGGGLLGLLFLIPFTRHEDDPFYRTLAVNALLGLGAALAVGSVVAGLAKPDFLAGPGLALALLGLGYLCAYLGQVDTSDGPGYLVAFALGAFGAAVAVYAVARSTVPTMLYEGPTALRKADNSLDAWKVAVRVLVGWAFVAAAAYGVIARRLPLWLRSTLVAVGVAAVGVLVYSSTTRAPMSSPGAPFLVPGGVLLGGIGLVYLAIALGACSDNPFVTLTRRELSSYFMSAVGYLVLGGMVVSEWLGYWFFVNGLEAASRRGGGMPEPIVQFYLLALIPVIAQTFLIPALTMRLLAEEKRTGSLEVLLTAPVTETSVVLSKFVATWLFFLLTWVPAALLLIPLRIELGQEFDYKPLLSFYLALGACGAAFVGMGLFFSAVTRNQIVAAVLTFVGMLLFLVFYFVKERTLGFGTTPQLVMTKLSYVDLWIEALSGQLPVRDILLWSSLAVFWLFLALKVLEVRKWS